MPPTFPITVSAENYGALSGNQVGFGPFPTNATTRYLIYYGENGVQSTDTLAAIKSTDNGVTWTAMDEAGAPTLSGFNDANYTACYDGSRYIWVTYMQGDFTVSIAAYDTSNDTWGSPIAGPTGVTGSSLEVESQWISAVNKVAIMWPPSETTCVFQFFNPSDSTFETQTEVSNYPGLFSPLPWSDIVEGAGGVVHFTTMQFQGIHSNLVFQSINANTLELSTVQEIDTVNEGDVGINSSMVYNANTGLLTLAYNSSEDPDPTVASTITILQGTSQLDVVFAGLTSLVSPGLIGTDYGCMFLGLTGTSQLALFWVDNEATFYYSQNFAAPTVLGTADILGNLRSVGFVSATTLTGYALAWGTNGYWELNISPPTPPPTVVGIPYGGRMPPPINPNDYTMCLVREYHLFKKIDYTQLECCRPPSCIIQDYVEAVGIGWEEPSDGLAFNPTSAISLPAPSDGEVVIFEEPVPIGYDGMILAHFHGYIPSPSNVPLNPFSEGSGDIAWRITSNNRYVKDSGNMLVSIGSTQRLSPIYGGIRVRSGDLLSYRVQVYNLSGLLTPGLGSIIAGLHGFFYSRK